MDKIKTVAVKRTKELDQIHMALNEQASKEAKERKALTQDAREYLINLGWKLNDDSIPELLVDFHIQVLSKKDRNEQ